MKIYWKWILVTWSGLVLYTMATAVPCPAMDASQIVTDAFRYWRGEASVAEVEMLIHRPTWERRMTIAGWTRGDRESLFRITEPAKDRGNGTLKKDRNMWMYNPKINRIIKLPPSMMSQSWMGSDFSNNDLSKTDSLLREYEHRITGTEEMSGMRVFLIESIPREDAPVIWGKQRLKIREDHIFLLQEFYDEDGLLVKAMSAEQIEMLGDKRFPRVWVMRQADKPDEYTKLTYRKLQFKKQLPDRIFSITNLKNPER